MFAEKDNCSRTYRSGQIILPQGYVGEAMGLVEKGRVEIFSKSEDGDETVYRVLGPEEVFGTDSFFKRLPRSKGVRALGNAQVAIMDKRDFIRRSQDNSRLAFGVLQSISRRIRDKTDEMEREVGNETTEALPVETAVGKSEPYRGIVLQATLGILIHPAAFYSRVRELDLFRLATLLQLFRWMFLSWVTMRHFHFREAPVFLPIPFGIEQQAYRYFEMFAYFPFGMALTAFIAYEIWVHGREHALRPMAFSKVWEVVAFAWFAPWLPTALLDQLLLIWNMAQTHIIVPLHVAVVVAEVSLMAIGLQQVFDIPRRTSWSLGIFAGAIFLVLGGLVVR